MSRRDRVAFLLEHIRDCTGPSSSASGTSDGDGPGFILTSSMAEHPSVVELVRCLGVLRRMAPTHGKHVDAYYNCGWVVERVPQTAKRGNKRVQLRNSDGTVAVVLRRARALPPWLQVVPRDPETGEPRTVARGVDFITVMFDGEPFIPRQLLDAAA